MSRVSRLLIPALGLCFLFFVLPGPGGSDHGTGPALVLTLIAAAGILLSRIFVLSSGSEDPVGIEPAVLVAVASWELPVLIYPVTLFFTLAGGLINSIRSERGLRSGLSQAVFQGVLFTVLLRAGTELYELGTGILGTTSATSCFAALTVTSLFLTFMRTISTRLTGEQTGTFGRNLSKNLISNGFILLPAVPAALSAVRYTGGIGLMTEAGLGLFAMLFIHGMSIRLNRSGHERTAELDTVLKLRELFENLFTSRTSMEVLRTLCRTISEAWQCRASVSWKGLKYYHGEPWDTEGAVSCSHPDGLTVWVDTFSSTVPEYLESFVNRTVPVLDGLEAEKAMNRTSWESMETMVSLLEANRSEFAGFSRKVAETAWQLAGALEKTEWFRDCVRLSGLLHIMNLTDLEKPEGGSEPITLPEITMSALRYQNEHWCGTGPGGLKGKAIPLSARILSVSVAWEKALKSGGEVAVRDLRMRAGTLYDPDLVDILLELNG